ncbi:MAG: hypothetical protein GXO79_11485 [Chlorobi bacterium]|nr:hypothetical protein [Chlorobiota bacterium]
MKKKNYNPFKMWGSWMGASVGLYIYLRTAIIKGTFCPKLNHIILLNTDKTVKAVICSSQAPSQSFLPYILIIIGFFMIGWGLGLLWRKYK